MPVYTDIESLRKYRDVFMELPDRVVATEKIHGANGRYTFRDGRLWCGSRTGVKARDPKSIWWQAAERADLELKLSTVPGLVVFGEVYGDVQNMKYGARGGNFVAFDAYFGSRYLDHDQFVEECRRLDIPRVPELYYGMYGDLDWSTANGSAGLGGDHCREGFVVKPVRERWDDRMGRVIAKLVGEDYMLKKTRA